MKTNRTGGARRLKIINDIKETGYGQSYAN